MDTSTQSMFGTLTTPEMYNDMESQGSITTSYTVVVVGACLSLPIVMYIAYVVCRHRRRHGYIDLDKAIASIKTASPRESESQDAHGYFVSSTESDTGKSWGDDVKTATFYIGVDSEEEMTSSHFVNNAYLPTVHMPKRKALQIHYIMSI